MQPIERRVLTREQFASEHVARSEPVIISGAPERWSAYGKWSLDYFATRYGTDQIQVSHLRPGHHVLDRTHTTTTVREYIEDIRADRVVPHTPGTRVPYLVDWSQCFIDHPELCDDLRPNDWFEHRFDRLPSQLRKTYPHLAVGWLLMGPAHTVFNLHFDLWSMHAWLAQFEGRKHVVMFPPDQATNLYRGFVDLDKPDYEKHPALHNVEGRRECLLEPGDLLFVPSRWWHQVTALSPSLTLSANFIDGTNVERVLADLERASKQGMTLEAKAARSVLKHRHILEMGSPRPGGQARRFL